MYRFDQQIAFAQNKRPIYRRFPPYLDYCYYLQISLRCCCPITCSLCQRCLHYNVETYIYLCHGTLIIFYYVKERRRLCPICVYVCVSRDCCYNNNRESPRRYCCCWINCKKKTMHRRRIQDQPVLVFDVKVDE